MITWLLSQFPWWAWAVLGLGVVLAGWRILGLKAALAVVAAAAAAVSYRKGMTDGGASERAAQQAAQDAAVKQSAAIKADVGKLSDDAVEKELRKWAKP